MRQHRKLNTEKNMQKCRHEQVEPINIKMDRELRTEEIIIAELSFVVLMLVEFVLETKLCRALKVLIYCTSVKEIDYY